MRPSLLLAGIRSAPLRQTVGACLFLALLLQASIPVGYMPGAKGSSLIKLCTGWAPNASAPVPGRTDHRGVSVCSFAASTLLGGIEPGAIQSVCTLTLVSYLVLLDRSISVPRAGPTRAQTPRAPPFSFA